jgi:hypothetical protein
VVKTRPFPVRHPLFDRRGSLTRGGPFSCCRKIAGQELFDSDPEH